MEQGGSLIQCHWCSIAEEKLVWRQRHTGRMACDSSHRDGNAAAEC